jgi:hypothetical protein
MIFALLHRKQKIVFLYAKRYEHSGSTVMRGEQLSSIIKKYYGTRYTILYRPLSTHYNNCVLFLTKGAVTDITEDQLSKLILQGNKVLLDPVDNPLDVKKAQLATGVVAASLEALDSYRKSGFPAYLVNHHVDIRIPRNLPEKAEGLHCGYFGELINTIKTDKIATLVDFVHVDTGKQSSDWLAKPPEYNLHYAIRSNNVEAFKPFLKGFTAAACEANIVIQKDQKEAIRWLGKDYPYLVTPNPTEQDILDMLDYVQQSYGSKEWKKGLQRMQKIRQATSDQTIADEFIDIVNLLSTRHLL